MPDYHVEWSITVSADSPEEAAKQCRLMQLDPSSMATVFDIPLEDGTVQRVDLDELGWEPPMPTRTKFTEEVQECAHCESEATSTPPGGDVAASTCDEHQHLEEE